MPLTGQGIFRAALLIEVIGNVLAIIPTILNPEYALSWVVRGPAQITPAAKALTQWIGGILVLAAAPLILCYPGPAPGEPASNVTAKRRLTYNMIAASEVVLASTTLWQYLSGDSGMTDRALLSSMGITAGFTSMRVFFLFVKPQWMEGQESLKKVQ